ncbi:MULTISPECIES: MarR family transcriptional regulator [Bacillus cereus group]|uniref:MarR family transcriptional regulator n=1 Tax=Bacillus cereus TaxID=1396 RepID=A0AA44QCP1_BACCE|nr:MULTISPECIES: MarR family transcriptional regulator [Bacillus cereus group]PFN06196.1 MarR family transcriptional regulator [Bacillus cereus]PFO83476.1 MarR family transcriptional regulator [Bacillus cereus]PFR32564.1 MarR family transcriptional regulator [Bacillus cereus]PFS05044.1 MarR family transcriptional regulator [Bacillus cereus]
MKIGVIGSKFFLDSLSKHYPLFPEVKFISYQYENPEQSGMLVEEAGRETDLVLFSGSIPFYFGYKQVKNSSIEGIYILFDELTVALSLLSTSHLGKVNINKISIDLPDQNLLLKVLEESEIVEKSLHVKDYPWIYKRDGETRELKIAEFVQFHSKLYHEGQTLFALTSIHAVYQELQRLDIPSRYMVQSKQTLIDSLTKAISLLNLKKTEESRIAVISIQSYQQSLKKSEQFLIFLQKLSKRLHARVNLEYLDPNLIYTTRGALQAFGTDYYSDIIVEMEKEFKTLFQVGIGYGYTIQEAETHSAQALFFTNKFLKNNSIACLVDENQKLHGPLFEKTHHVELKNEDQAIQELAGELKMSAKNIKLIYQFIKINNFKAFSAANLEEYMNCTRRSAERFIKRLIDGGCFLQAGEEHPYEQGRPRNLYIATDKLKGVYSIHT